MIHAQAPHSIVSHNLCALPLPQLPDTFYARRHVPFAYNLRSTRPLDSDSLRDFGEGPHIGDKRGISVGNLAASGWAESNCNNTMVVRADRWA